MTVVSARTPPWSRSPTSRHRSRNSIEVRSLPGDGSADRVSAEAAVSRPCIPEKSTKSLVGRSTDDPAQARTQCLSGRTADAESDTVGQLRTLSDGSEALEDCVSDVSRALDDAPDPTAVSTVEDLTVFLRLLQIYDGKPPVREIARRTKDAGNEIPSSTVQDALKGNRGLPHVNVVLAIVQALGVTDRAPWRSAWTRAAQAKAGLPSAVTVPPSVAPPVSAGRAGVDVSRIATANEATAARLIEAGDVDEVTHVLAGLDDLRAASRLDQTAPERVALVLDVMDEHAAARIASRMKPSTAAAAFEAMPPAAAGRVLVRIPYDRIAARIHPLTSSTGAAILQHMADWPKFLGGMHKLEPADLVRFLAAMPPGGIARFFEPSGNNSRGAMIIAGVSAEDAARILRSVSLDQAVTWLAALQPKGLAAALAGLDDAEALAILQRLPQKVVNGRGRAFVEGFGEAELVRLLAQLPKQAIEDWLGRLRGLLTRPSVDQLVASVRKAA